MKRLACIWIATILITGCSYFTRPLEQPVIEEKLNESFLSKAEVGTLSLTPERRVVLVNFKNKRFCAEAPTEVGNDLSSLIKATAEAKKGEELGAGLGAILAATSNHRIINKRSQGMQLFLANSYFLCQMYLNGALEDEDLLRIQLETFNAVLPLINNEIPLLYGDDKTANATGTTVQPLDINRLLQGILDKGSAKDKPGADVPDGPADVQ